MRRALALLVASSLTLSLVSAVTVRAQLEPVSKVRAGVGIADATWSVGANAGQHASDRNPMDELDGETDPNSYSKIKHGSYGVQSRLTVRALVIEGNNQQRVALVKTDNYLAQDMLQRRVGQLLAAGTSGVTNDRILITASHNHSSPYNVSLSAGVAVFQDAFDARMFEYQARAIASAIEDAARSLKPARVGATTVQHTAFKGNVVGPSLADDGTPTGYPLDFGDTGLVVLRVDDLSGPDPKPLAVWTNFGMHPESLDSYDLITADFLAPLERFVDREIGAPLIFSQGDVGSAEGPSEGEDPRLLPNGVQRAWYHTGFAQAERGARLLANSVIQGWNEIGAGQAQVPFSTDFPVAVYDGWIPGPVSHPYPAANACRTETTIEGDPGVGTAADCTRSGDNGGPTIDPHQMLLEDLKARGLPVPENYDTPAFVALEENNRIHLQAVRLGDILLGSCSCEAQVDLILNFESRANDKTGDIFDGFDWSPYCKQNANTTWTCTMPRSERPDQPIVTTVPDYNFKRMQAQIHNDAKGWDDPAYAPYANAEPADNALIKGNFTKEELPPSLGYKLVVGVGHAGDYDGYTVSYREFMSRDHYRKALTSYGPHTADYMVTNLVRMGGALKGGPALPLNPLVGFAAADEARQVATAAVLGQASAAAYDGYQATLPDDKNPGTIVTQPANVTRFATASFAWKGGSNAIDNPVVRVERLVGETWQPYADQSGEIQVAVTMPPGVEGVATTKTGSQEWQWVAGFEAFSAWPRGIDPRGDSTPAGTYRFVVDGKSRQARATKAYHLASAPFTVRPWDGIKVTDLRADEGGSVSFLVDPIAYPKTAPSPLRMVKDDKRAGICKTCSFRPWARAGEVASATVTVTRANGAVERVPAGLVGGRWVAPVALAAGDTAAVLAGDVVDTYGEINGTPSTL